MVYQSRDQRDRLAEALRMVNGDTYRDNYEAAFRKAKWPHDDNPFMSPDHDNDSSVYDEAVASVHEDAIFSFRLTQHSNL